MATLHVSNGPVMFVTHERFTVVFFLLSVLQTHLEAFRGTEFSHRVQRV